MNLNKTPVYFKPLFWQKEYYSIDEFSSLLGFQQALFKKKLYQAILDDFYKATYTGFEDVYQFERVRGTLNANGFLTPNVLTKQNRSCFLPFYDGGDIGFLVAKEGVLAFIDAYQEKLIDLGVSKTRIKAILHNIPFQKTEPKNVMTMWDFAKKFTKNSKNVKQLADYISNTFFDTYYPKKMPDGQVQNEPMFLYWRGKRRATNFFFNLDALDYFKKQFAPLLAKKEAEIEEGNEFISIRHYLLKVSGKYVADKKLVDFIKAHALDATFVDMDEKGNAVQKPVFEMKHNIISMRKNAVFSFTKQYQNELEALGFFNMQHILNQSLRLSELPSDALVISKLIKESKLIKFAPEIEELVAKAYLKQQNTASTKKEPFLKAYYRKNKEEYYINVQDKELFFKKFYTPLLKLGVDKDRLDSFAGKRELPKRNKSMVLIRDLFYMLGIHPKQFKRMKEEILNQFVHDTFEFVDENGKKTHQNVFIKANSQHSVSYVIQNKQAMQSFLKARGDYFLKNKVNPLRLNDASGVQPIPLANEDQMTVEALALFLSLPNRFKYYVSKNLLAETYLSSTKEGTTVEKKMFSRVRSKKGHIVYAIDKAAINTLQEKIKVYKINSDRQRKR